MIIQFKTKEPYYEKEEDGLKCNTVRKVDGYNDVRFEDLMELIQADDYFGSCKGTIRIINPTTKESFERQITNVTYFDERFIISWKHKSSQKTRNARLK